MDEIFLHAFCMTRVQEWTLCAKKNICIEGGWICGISSNGYTHNNGKCLNVEIASKWSPSRYIKKRCDLNTSGYGISIYVSLLSFLDPYIDGIEDRGSTSINSLRQSSSF